MLLLFANIFVKKKLMLMLWRLMFYVHDMHQEFWRNSRGVQLFTCKWLPLSSPKALVFLCHG